MAQPADAFTMEQSCHYWSVKYRGWLHPFSADGIAKALHAYLRGLWCLFCLAVITIPIELPNYSRQVMIAFVLPTSNLTILLLPGLKRVFVSALIKQFDKDRA